MKKFLAIITLAASLLTLFVGCKKELEPIEKAQARVVKIGEQYLNYEITAAEAVALLKGIRVPDAKKNDFGKEWLETSISILIRLIENPNSSYEAIKGRIQNIKTNKYAAPASHGSEDFIK